MGACPFFSFVLGRIRCPCGLFSVFDALHSNVIYKGFLSRVRLGFGVTVSEVDAMWHCDKRYYGNSLRVFLKSLLETPKPFAAVRLARILGKFLGIFLGSSLATPFFLATKPGFPPSASIALSTATPPIRSPSFTTQLLVAVLFS